MAKVLIKNSVTSGSAPAGLSLGEMAINITDRKIFTGNAVESAVTIFDPNTFVTSVNGATGAITNVARTNEGNTFSVLQVMSVGISAANLNVTSGATFNTIYTSSTTNNIDIVSSTDGIGLRIARSTGGGASSIGGIRLGRNGTTALNYLLYGANGTFYVINGTGGSDPQLMSLNSVDANFNVPIRGATFSSTDGRITVQKSSVGPSDSGTVRIVGADTLGTPYNSDIRANDSAAADTTHTLPAVTGTLLNTASSYVTGVNGITGPVGIAAGSNININSSGKTLTISGTTASVINIGSSNVNATRYLTFVGGSGATALSIDDVTTPLSYNPLQGNIGAKKVTLTTSSNVITLDSANPNVIITDGASISTFSADSFTANSVSKFTVSNAIGITLQGGNGPNQGIGIAMTNASYELPVVNGSSGRAMVWPSSGSGLTWSDVVTSVNGSAGAVTNVARLNEGNTFSVRQVMNAGITASNLYVSSGSTFNSTVEISSTTNTLDVIASTDGAGLRIAQASSGGNARIGSIRLGRGSAANTNTYLENSIGTFTIYNGVGNTGTNMFQLTNAQASFGVPITAVTFSAAPTSDGGYRLSSSAINSRTGTTYTLLSSDDGKILTWNATSGSTLTVPSGLPVGFNTTLISIGTGSIGITGSGVTLNSFEGKLRIAGQHAAVSIISYTTNVFNVAGGLTS